jgi:hypothetical protein
MGFSGKVVTSASFPHLLLIETALADLFWLHPGFLCEERESSVD